VELRGLLAGALNEKVLLVGNGCVNHDWRVCTARFRGDAGEAQF
jgi:hypothetical protein